MAVLGSTEVTFRPELSPRIIIVEDPRTELTVQDLHDTVCAWQDEPPNHDYDVMIDSAGKEDLGGGVSVGITTTLLNAQVMFRARTTILHSGTATSADAQGQVLTDTGANFTGTPRGSILFNTTDVSQATVLEVLSPTSVRVDGLRGGTDDEFGIGDGYQIFEVVRCDLTGGNLVAVDDVGAALDPILPSFGTNVTRTSSSSATQLDQIDIRHAAFENGVSIDVVNGTPGTDHPAGTKRQPVNNLADAVVIATENGLDRIYVIGDLTLGAGDVADGFAFEGQSKQRTMLTLGAAASIVGCEFYNCEITGTLDGGSKVMDCEISPSGLTYVDGFVERSVLNGTITLSGVATAHFLWCVSGVPGVSTPTIDFNNSGAALAMRGYDGGIQLTNKSGAASVSLDINSGQVILDSTVTNGTIVVRGVAKLTDNSTGAAIVDTSGHLDPQVDNDVALLRYTDGAIWIDANNGTAGTVVGVNGTSTTPVATLADALAIADATGYRAFVVVDGTLTLTRNLTEWEIRAHSNEVVVNLNGWSVNGSTFFQCTLTGTMTGTVMARACLLDDVSGFAGVAHDCGISGTLALGVGRATFHLCYSDVPGTATPTINFVGAGRSVNLRGYSGGIKLENMTDVTNVITVEQVAGQVILDASCTDGVAVLRGIQKVADNSAGTLVDLDASLYPAQVRAVLGAILGVSV